MVPDTIRLLLFAITATAVRQSELCLQGCCGLAFKLPSTSLTLHHLTIAESSVQVPLQASELLCCPCGDALNGTENPVLPT